MKREWADRSLQSEALRAALRTAERVLRVSLSLTDPRLEGDRETARDLNEAISLVMERRLRLENGHWPERSVSPYPIHPERSAASMPAETPWLDDGLAEGLAAAGARR